jgi:3-hydroxyacyl-CoA dehydrogenase
MNGYDVILYDLRKEIVDSAVENVKRMLDVLIENAVLKESQRTGIMSRISTTTELADVKGADYVQESVVERLNVKTEVFKSVESFVAEDTIIASSTSGLPMSEIQKPLQRPERTVTVHPFNPPHLIPLIEIVAGKRTSPQTVKTVQEFMTSLRKEPIVVKREVTGFAADRIQDVVEREILSLLDDDVVDMEDIEKIFYSGVGIRLAIMGPFTINSLAGGPGGLEYELDHYEHHRRDVLSTVKTWTSIPDSAREKAITQIKELSSLKGRSYDELARWRDRKLIALLKHLGYL